MKKLTFFLCLAFILLDTQILPAQWSSERRFKVFRQVMLNNDSLEKKLGFKLMDLGFGKAKQIWGDSIIVCNANRYDFHQYDSFPSTAYLMKININSGKCDLLADSSTPEIRITRGLFAKGQPVFDRISTWGGLGAATLSHYDEILNTFGSDRAGVYIFGENNFSRILTNDTISKLIGEDVYLSDCTFASDGKLIAAVQFMETLEAGIISSIDTGKTWKKEGNPFTITKFIVWSWEETAPSFMLVGNQKAGNYHVSSSPNLIRKHYFTYSNDEGQHWSNIKLPNEDDALDSLTKLHYPLKFYNSNSPGIPDTLYTMQFRGNYSAQELYATYDRGQSWRTILKRQNNESKEDYYLTPVTEFFGSSVIYVPVIDGIGITTNGGESWCKYSDDPGSRIAQIMMFDRRRGVAFSHDTGDFPGRSRIFYFEIDDDFCGNDGFEYFSFINTEGLALKGNAGRVGDYVRLTESKTNQAGSLWRDKPIAFDKSFDCRFGFNLSDGINNEADSTSPGADGIALVITKEIPTAPGEIGGGIGYNGISSAVAIEFDSFVNNNRDDPNYDHTAVFASSGAIKNNHSDTDCIGTARIAPDLKSSLQKREVLVKYDKTSKTLSVYMDDKEGLGAPVLTIKDFDFEKYLGSSIGYIGITSSTGESMENHFISDISLCFNDETVLGVEEPTQQASATENAYPNPAREELKIKIPEKMAGKEVTAKIYDLCGRVFFMNTSYISGGKEMRINLSSIPTGFYYVALSDGLEFVTVPFIKN